MAIRRRGRARKHPAVELNITAFMNLMVVLVPFLLMTAVFTHLTILELNLPAADSTAQPDPKKPPYELYITIRKDALNISDNRGGLIGQAKKTDQGHDYVRLAEILKQVKARLPEQTAIIIRPEQDTPYDILVQVMDSSRMYKAFSEGELIDAELFPDISIGDAPALKK
ncbi:MAG: biopolymer transporter ExbD [Gammaproteobacteria bacterium]|nr:biopolymer transporter ExbD [Gammaproteobacteria bacterium]